MSKSLILILFTEKFAEFEAEPQLKAQKQSDRLTKSKYILSRRNDNILHLYFCTDI